MKKLFLILTVVIVAMFAFTACNSTGDDAPVATPLPGPAETPGPIETPAPPQEVIEGDVRMHEHGLEIVTIDGEEVFRFTETQNLSVLAWNRADARQPNISESYWADFIRAEVLRMHNIDVEFVQIYRWGPEEQVLATFLAGGTAPDVSFTFQMPTVQTFADMDGVHDLTPIFERYLDFAPHLHDLVGMTNLTWNQNQQYGHNWAIAGRHYGNTLRMNTFVRGDWLDALGLSAPTTTQQFEDMLVAFRDNAELLLGADASHMIPFSITSDAGWTGDPVITSFIPSGITDRQWYVYGFDDRRFTMPGVKEGVRLLNRWFNMGLIWEDFPLHDPNDPRAANLKIMGFVGAFSGNWDWPFRTAPGIIRNMQLEENAGPDAHFVVVAPFRNDAGEVRMQVPHGTDRSIFFPRTNENVVASMIYLDWISRPEVRDYLMFGVYDVNHTSEDGVMVWIPADDVPDHVFIPSLRNFDLLPTFNLIPPDTDPRLIPLAFAFEGVPQHLVDEAVDVGMRYAWVGPRAVTRTVEAEAQFGGGLPLLRDQALNQAIVASEAEFDAVFDALMRNYLNAGGQMIIDERNAAWVEIYGNVDWLPAP